MTLLATPLHAHPALSGFPTHPARLDTDVRKDAVPTPTALRSRASQLHAAACLWPGADDALRGQTQAILQTANRFHADPLTHPQQLAQLDRLISALPQDLLRVAGHFAALDADRQEADRLTAALDGIVRTRRVSGAELCTIRNRVEGAQLRIDAARKDLEAGQLKPMGEHAATIRGQLAFARTFLERHQFIESRSTHADVPHPAQAPQPGKPKVSPSTLLHSALSHLARTAKSARKALVRQLPSTPPQQMKAAAKQDRSAALSPLRAELSELTRDIEWAEQRRDLLLHTPASASAAGQSGRPGWARHTLGVLLKDARNAEHKALQALGRGDAKAEAVASQASETIRSKLKVFNETLRIADLDTLDFKFLQRDRPAGTTVPG